MAAILSVEKFSLAMADTVTSVTGNLSAAAVTNLTMLVSVRNTNTVEVGWNDLMARGAFLTGPNRVQVDRSGGDGAMDVEVVVIEWNTNEVTIQENTFSMIATELTDNVTVTAVDLTKAFVVHNYITPFEGDLDDNYIRCMMDSTTNVKFEREDAGQTGTVTGRFWVVEDDLSNFTVQRVQDLSITQLTADATITSVDTTKTLVTCSQQNSQVGENPDDLGIGFLFDATTFRFERNANSGTTIVDAFIVEWADTASVVYSVQRGRITLGSGVSTGTDTTTEVNLTKSFAHLPMSMTGCSSSDLTLRQTAFMSILQNSSTQVEANGKDDSSTELVEWEVFDYLIQGKPVMFGAAF